MSYKRVASYKSPEQLAERLSELGVSLPIDPTVEHGPDSILAQPIALGNRKIGNRWCILPMEGWDGEPDGKPSDLVRRRWSRFGQSGAKLIWGGEAVAVREDGRANPHQLVINEANLSSLAELRETLIREHASHFGTSDLVIGLQLTHSGRFSRPVAKGTPSPRTAYRHPLLDRRVNIVDDQPVLSDDELKSIIDEFVRAGRQAQSAGFDFVDIKHCHGYLGHELLSAHDRKGLFGGSFENRTRFLRDIVQGVRAEAKGLELGVRLSAFDFVPFAPGPDSIGLPESIDGPYRYAFGGDGTGTGIDLAEPSLFLGLLAELGIRLVCLSAGSPYYCPHMQRPALFPPSDGYLPPEDPLVGVARQVQVTSRLKAEHPEAIIVGSGYSYLQDWLGHVAQAVVRTGGADSIGLGRMVLSYPEMPADLLLGRPLQRKKICRTFSDCTTAPRNGLVSGCYPLDPFYKSHPSAEQLKAHKEQGNTGEPATKK